MTRRYRRAAFFDVDETLIVVASLSRFLRHHFAAIGRPSSAYREVVEDLRDLAGKGLPRAELIRAYYRNYAGQRTAEVSAQGREWFERERRSGEFFLPAAVRAFSGHRRDGDLTVLVSGSFAACLDPIAEWLGAELVFGAQLETADDLYTGGVTITMIGPDKAEVARSVLRDHGIPPRDSHAYGDHPSDLPLLRTVGHPAVIGDDPVLAVHAIAGSWPRLPGLERNAAAPGPSAALSTPGPPAPTRALHVEQLLFARQTGAVAG
jgi:HAD superfamily hydrolase (TIGR01490 family)